MTRRRDARALCQGRLSILPLTCLFVPSLVFLGRKSFFWGECSEGTAPHAGTRARTQADGGRAACDISDALVRNHESTTRSAIPPTRLPRGRTTHTASVVLAENVKSIFAMQFVFDPSPRRGASLSSPARGKKKGHEKIFFFFRIKKYDIDTLFNRRRRDDDAQLIHPFPPLSFFLCLYVYI